MKNQSIKQMLVYSTFTLFFCVTASTAEATTIVNYVHAESGTGGQKVTNGADGQDGQDGKNGQDGQKGQDGQSVTSSNGTVSVYTKSVVNGVTVFESSDVKVGEQKTFVETDEKSATSVDKNDISVHLTAQAGLGAQADLGAEADLGAQTVSTAQTDAQFSPYVQVHNVLDTIRLIFMSYVSKLF